LQPDRPGGGFSQATRPPTVVSPPAVLDLSLNQDHSIRWSVR
jgi:hypothetical protein